MIVLVHSNNRVVNVYDYNSKKTLSFDSNASISVNLINTAKDNPDALLMWVNEVFQDKIAFNALPRIFHHKLIMASFAVSGGHCISQKIGYVEQTPYTNMKRYICYPTWLMSADIGGVNATVLNTISQDLKSFKHFDFFLNTLAKRAMPKGLLCYSNPDLSNEVITENKKKSKASVDLLFKFVRQNYKWIWSINLLVCFLVYEKRIPLISFLKALFYKKPVNNIDFGTVNVKSTRVAISKKEVDVIIPTIGRMTYLHDVLKDLSRQTYLPKKVIIVEQNLDINATSELDYVTTETWPFKIDHLFIHQTGVCNARNMALDRVESPWVFLADDDIRFESDLIEKAFVSLDKFGGEALNLLCLGPKEKQKYFFACQTDIFGSGTSFVKSSLFSTIKFNNAFEFGYGEDSDFGMQIRNQGTDIIFTPNNKITHLKAPVGGLRIPHVPLWKDDKIQPKPSPTMMLYVKMHYNEFQVLGYKYTLFVKFYKQQSIKNPWRYLKLMTKQWERSLFWADLLNEEKGDLHI